MESGKEKSKTGSTPNTNKGFEQKKRNGEKQNLRKGKDC